MVEFRRLTAQRIAQGLLLIATALASYLLVHTLLEKPVAGCGSSGGCDAVLNSRWGYWFGFPVTLLALGAYVPLFVFTLQPTRKPTALYQIARPTICLAILAAAAWFTIVQAAILRRFCPYCLALHVAGGAASILLLIAAQNRSPRWLLKSASLAAAAVATFIAGQYLQSAPELVEISVTTGDDASAPTTAPASAPAGRVIYLPYGMGAVNMADVPVIGEAQAPHTIAVLFDFTCASCRRSHPRLEELAKAFRGQLCIALLPSPLEATCNSAINYTEPAHVGACDYARLSLALWRHRPEDFHAFCREFVNSESPQSVERAVAWAQKRVGGAQTLDRLLADPWVSQQISRNTERYGTATRRTGRDEMPKLIIGPAVITGAAEEVDTMIEWVRKYGGVPMPQ